MRWIGWCEVYWVLFNWSIWWHRKSLDIDWFFSLSCCFGLNIFVVLSSHHLYASPIDKNQFTNKGNTKGIRRWWTALFHTRRLKNFKRKISIECFTMLHVFEGMQCGVSAENLKGKRHIQTLFVSRIWAGALNEIVNDNIRSQWQSVKRHMFCFNFYCCRWPLVHWHKKKMLMLRAIAFFYLFMSLSILNVAGLTRFCCCYCSSDFQLHIGVRCEIW